MNKLPDKAQQYLDAPMDGQDRQRFQQIRWRRTDGGYFGYFDEPEQAYKYLKYLSVRYKYSDHNTIKSLCEESAKYGITVYEVSVGKWFKQVFDLDIKMAGGPRSNRDKIELYFDKEIINLVKQLHTHSRFLKTEYINTLFRAFMGLPIEYLVVFFDEIPVTFIEWTGEWFALTMAELPTDDKKYVDSLLYDAKEHGLPYIRKKAMVNGHKCIGGLE